MAATKLNPRAELTNGSQNSFFHISNKIPKINKKTE